MSLNILLHSGGGLAGIVGLSMAYAYGTKFEKNITVKKNYTRVTRYMDGPPNHIYMISDSNNDSYALKKSLLYNHWNNNKLWVELEENSSHKVTGFGWRIPMLDIYPVIIKTDKYLT